MITTMRNAKFWGLISFIVAVAIGAALAIMELGSPERAASPLMRTLAVRTGTSPTTMPTARIGLVATADNQGLVLFGRYCDVCHPGGGAGNGSDLRSVQTRREVKTLDDLERVVRDGGYDMPAFPKTLVSDKDLEVIDDYVMKNFLQPVTQ